MPAIGAWPKHTTRPPPVVIQNGFETRKRTALMIIASGWGSLMLATIANNPDQINYKKGRKKESGEI